MSKISQYPPGPGLNGSEMFIVSNAAGTVNYTYTSAQLATFANVVANSPTWGSILGSLSSQADLLTQLNTKATGAGVTVGTVGTLNFPGNTTTVLRGDGTFVAAPFLAVQNTFTKAQVVTPIQANVNGTYTPDASASNNFQLTATGNVTLAAPTNLTIGEVLNFTLDENATGNFTFTLNAIYHFPGGVTPTWGIAANSKNFFSGYYDGTIIRCGGGVGY